MGVLKICKSLLCPKFNAYNVLETNAILLLNCTEGCTFYRVRLGQSQLTGQRKIKPINMVCF